MRKMCLVPLTVWPFGKGQCLEESMETSTDPEAQSSDQEKLSLDEE
jgi:hypothetical protein